MADYVTTWKVRTPGGAHITMEHRGASDSMEAAVEHALRDARAVGQQGGTVTELHALLLPD